MKLNHHIHKLLSLAKIVTYNLQNISTPNGPLPKKI